MEFSPLFFRNGIIVFSTVVRSLVLFSTGRTFAVQSPRVRVPLPPPPPPPVPQKKVLTHRDTVALERRFRSFLFLGQPLNWSSGSGSRESSESKLRGRCSATPLGSFRSYFIKLIVYSYTLSNILRLLQRVLIAAQDRPGERHRRGRSLVHHSYGAFHQLLCFSLPQTLLL